LGSERETHGVKAMGARSAEVNRESNSVGHQKSPGTADQNTQIGKRFPKERTRTGGDLLVFHTKKRGASHKGPGPFARTFMNQIRKSESGQNVPPQPEKRETGPCSGQMAGRAGEKPLSKEGRPNPEPREYLAERGQVATLLGGLSED